MVHEVRRGCHLDHLDHRFVDGNHIQEDCTMTHTDHQQHISLYIDNALNDSESSELFAHLAECSECRKYMKISMRVHSEIADEELADVSRSLDRRILASVARANATLEQRTWYSPIWFTRISIPLPAAASIVFLLIVGSLLFYPLLTAEQQQQVKLPAELISKVPSALQKAF
jgi:anti-sigma factor RsiW